MANQAAQEEVLLDVSVAEASKLYKFYLNQERKILGTIAVAIFLTVWELVGNTLQLISPHTRAQYFFSQSSHKRDCTQNRLFRRCCGHKSDNFS